MQTSHGRMATRHIAGTSKKSTSCMTENSLAQVQIGAENDPSLHLTVMVSSGFELRDAGLRE